MEELKAILFFSISVFLSLPVYSQIEAQGHHRAIFATKRSQIVGAEKESITYGVVNNGLTVLYSNDPHIFEASYELFSSLNSIRDPVYFSSLESDVVSYRAYELPRYLVKNNLYNSKSVRVEQNLDRLYYGFSNDLLSVTAGRQAIGFGVARTVNPTDVIAPFNLVMIDTEQRYGNDAIRAHISTTDLSEIDFGAIFGENLEDKNNAYFVSAKFPVLNWDLEFLVNRFKKNLLYGANFSGNIKGAGAWLELAYNDLKKDNRLNYLRSSTGLEYLFPIDLTILAEYHYSEAGSRNYQDYGSISSSMAFLEAGGYLLAKNYLIVGLTYLISPLVNISMSQMTNLDDSSLLFTPGFEWNIEQDLTIDVGASIGLGRKSSTRLAPKSEFGSYDNSIYTKLRYYF